MSSAELTRPTGAAALSGPRRFAVAWRNNSRKTSSVVGVLDYDGKVYRFRYLAGIAEAVDQFKPFIGFPDLNRVYTSPRLWPFFALRVMDRKRPDYSIYVHRLGLSTDADRLDVLARSGGERKGDSVSVVEEPRIARNGGAEVVFLVRGTRYAVADYGSLEGVTAAAPGDPLLLADDSTNVSNSDALLLTTASHEAVGWVPDLLLPFVHQLRRRGIQAGVLQNNGVDAPWHLRLLVRISGHADSTAAAFSGAGWPTRA